MMLADMVSDTANELHGYQRDQLVTHDAQVMSDANSMETMLQKIKLMEVRSFLLFCNFFFIIQPDEKTSIIRIPTGQGNLREFNLWSGKF